MKKLAIILLVAIIFVAGCSHEQSLEVDDEETKTVVKEPETKTNLILDRILSGSILNVKFDNPDPLKDFSSKSHLLRAQGGLEENFEGSGSYDSSGVYKFDGNDDYVKVVSPTGFNRKAITVVAWAKRRRGSITREHTLIVGGSSGSGALLLNPDEKVFFRLNIDGNDRETGQASFTDDKWVMFAGTWKDGSPLKLYKDGNLASESTSYSGSLSSFQKFWIGRYDFGTYFDGYIDNVVVFDKVLTADEIKTIYNG